MAIPELGQEDVVIDELHVLDHFVKALLVVHCVQWAEGRGLSAVVGELLSGCRTEQPEGVQGGATLTYIAARLAALVPECDNVIGRYSLSRRRVPSTWSGSQRGWGGALMTRSIKAQPHHRGPSPPGASRFVLLPDGNNSGRRGIHRHVGLSGAPVRYLSPQHQA